ncbi:MAG: beta-ketoacyl-[acyl-carrier-protein] synthase family protein [Sporocytophaga sp.]|uniref:beta-ketoacyl-[acyl-carrier-protein] synthase family protein n=1 Tax=Sporocytophaga sp. TaxID=2231183 RepID=UPI001B2888EB|nr:beta-ketoacyl-[acyl-carrier-protein] synthase family protein [Sporocytophaga sp.]MBO9700275.1 beta-ketoacyl-[acyl-carrier-protein] synthase family protein [Sporocytophaga sp.]
MNRVVITGIGIYSCLGTGLDQVRDSLFKGKSGIVFDEERKIMGFRSPLTGMVEKPVLKGILDRRQRIGLAEQGEYAYLSTLEAIKNAKLDEEIIDRNEFGVLFGNDSSARAVIEATDIIRDKKDTTLVGSGSVFQSMNSTVTMNLATIFKLKGVNFTVSGACASGSHAIGIGYFLIKHGLQKGVICGGAQEINPFSMGNFDALSTFSVRVDEPTRASRPFDKNRDGLVPSGGAATVIIESYESAIERGAPILAEIIGYGFSSNGGHISQPNVEGPVRALEMSLRDAGIPADLIDYVNAHATSTPVGDMYEARALDSVFGGSKPLVSSTKSMTGHECWMAGASEIVYSLLMMQNDFVAPNINLETPDEDSAKLNIATKTVEKNIDTLLSNSFGFGGTNSSLILKKVK